MLNDSGPPSVSAFGVNQTRARDHNERLILSLIQRHGGLPGSEIARQTGLSPQTVSVILRQLERDGIVEKGNPIRGKVGKPSIPVRLAADGILSIGLKIGRRSAELLLMDSLGRVRMQEDISYRYPQPGPVFDFLETGLARIAGTLPADLARRIAGVGIAQPFELWNWHSTLGAQQAEMDAWRGLDIAARVAQFTDLPVMCENDATAACRAEHVFGIGTGIVDMAYFFVGAFIGGGLVLNRSIWEGRTGNAGAFGTLPVGQDGSQLIDHASLYLLEARLAEAGQAIELGPANAVDWAQFGAPLDSWTAHAASHLARASLSLAAVIDFDSVVIDGSFPPEIRRRLVAATEAELAKVDSRGISLPRLREGSVGPNARAIGAAALPIISQYFLNNHGPKM